MLSSSSTNEFKKLFKGLTIHGRELKINKSYYISNLKTNPKFVKNNDLLNYSFFKLVEDSLNNIVILIDDQNCAASILNKFNDYYYPSLDIIYPYDFKFLNSESVVPESFKCVNKDTFRIREIGYNPDLIGNWVLDSILDSKENHYEESFEIMNIRNDSTVVFDDIETYRYFVEGSNFEIEDSVHVFYKIFNNDDFLILINTYNNSYSEYYLHKLVN